MKRQDIAYLVDRGSDLSLSVGGRESRVMRRYGEVYTPDEGRRSYTHVFELESNERVVAWFRNDEWYVLHATHRGKLPLSDIDRVVSGLRDVDSGSVSRTYAIRTDFGNPQRYVSGMTQDGDYLYLTCNEHDADVWVGKIANDARVSGQQ